jgi:GxxExxY protein
MVTESLPQRHRATEKHRDFRGNELTGEIIGAAIEVHRYLGPGLLESVYEECLAAEFVDRGFKIERQLELPVSYKGKRLNAAYRIDFLINSNVIVELKVVQKIEPVHKAQLLTYLKLAAVRYGLLLNFNVPVMKQGVCRLLNG